MRKFKKWTALLAAGVVWATTCFAGVPVLGSAQSISAAVQPEISSEDAFMSAGAAASEKRRGWYTLKNGDKRYYAKNGKYLVGKRKVQGKVYFFDKNGIMQKSVWITRNGDNYSKGSDPKKGKIYYFGPDGARYEGLKKVGKKYYYFSKKNGIMQTGIVKDGNVTYFFKENGVLEAKKKGSKYSYANGKVMGKTEGYEYETLQTAKKIVSEITNSSMSKAQKLETCFRWVMAKYYTNRRVFLKQDGWPALYANDHFLLGGGDCFSDGCAFAYLAKALGYKNIYVCVDTDKVNNNGHCWAEIDGLVYDPLFAQAKSFSRNYGVRYGVYVLSPRLKKAV